MAKSAKPVPRGAPALALSARAAQLLLCLGAPLVLLLGFSQLPCVGSMHGYGVKPGISLISIFGITSMISSSGLAVVTLFMHACLYMRRKSIAFQCWLDWCSLRLLQIESAFHRLCGGEFSWAYPCPELRNHHGSTTHSIPHSQKLRGPLTQMLRICTMLTYFRVKELSTEHSVLPLWLGRLFYRKNIGLKYMYMHVHDCACIYFSRFHWYGLFRVLFDLRWQPLEVVCCLVVSSIQIAVCVRMIVSHSMVASGDLMETISEERIWQRSIRGWWWHNHYVLISDF